MTLEYTTHLNVTIIFEHTKQMLDKNDNLR